MCYNDVTSKHFLRKYATEMAKLLNSDTVWTNDTKKWLKTIRLLTNAVLIIHVNTPKKVLGMEQC